MAGATRTAIRGELRLELPENQLANLLDADIRDSVLELRQGTPQSGMKVPVARHHLPDFLEPRHAGDEMQQPRLGRRLRRKLELFDDLGGKAGGGQAGYHEQHCVPDHGAPSGMQVRHQRLDRKQPDDPGAELAPEELAGSTVQGRSNGADPLLGGPESGQKGDYRVLHLRCIYFTGCHANLPGGYFPARR